MADGYQVINQTETVGKLPDDTYGPVVKVTFRTATGMVGSVNVPVASYSADTVRSMIEARVAEIEAVNQL